MPFLLNNSNNRKYFLKISMLTFDLLLLFYYVLKERSFPNTLFRKPFGSFFFFFFRCFPFHAKTLSIFMKYIKCAVKTIFLWVSNFCLSKLGKSLSLGITWISVNIETFSQIFSYGLCGRNWRAIHPACIFFLLVTQLICFPGMCF